MLPPAGTTPALLATRKDGDHMKISDQEFERRMVIMQSAEKINLPFRFHRANYGDWNPAIKNTPETYDDLKDGIIIAGPLRAGKTHLAAAILTELVPDCYSDNPRHLYQHWTKSHEVASFNPEEKEDALRCKILVLDDLGSERGTSFVSEAVFSLIDRRMDYLRPTIVTTSANADMIKERDSRLFARLEGFGRIYLAGDEPRSNIRETR